MYSPINGARGRMRSSCPGMVEPADNNAGRVLMLEFLEVCPLRVASMPTSEDKGRSSAKPFGDNCNIAEIQSKLEEETQLGCESEGKLESVSVEAEIKQKTTEELEDGK
jgi:hypothetical protein